MTIEDIIERRKPFNSEGVIEWCAILSDVGHDHCVRPNCICQCHVNRKRSNFQRFDRHHHRHDD